MTSAPRGVTALKRRGTQLGAVAQIAKPWSIDVLLATIAEVARTRGLRPLRPTVM